VGVKYFDHTGHSVHAQEIVVAGENADKLAVSEANALIATANIPLILLVPYDAHLVYSGVPLQHILSLVRRTVIDDDYFQFSEGLSQKAV
jgi:hypothetical protein